MVCLVEIEKSRSSGGLTISTPSELASTIDKRQELLVREFQGLSERMDRYRKLVELGRTHVGMPNELKVPEHQLAGCQYQVWIHGSLDSKGLLSLQADSDATITRGLLAILLWVWDRNTPQDIINSELYALEQMGLSKELSPFRANGLAAMVRRMHQIAEDFIGQS